MKPDYEELEKKIEVLEEQLRQRQRMDSLGTLAQGVAHDFNNILSGIMAYLNILSLTGDNFSAAQKTYVQNIINAVKRGAAIIRQFQKLSRNSIPLKKNIDMHAVAEEVFNLLEKTSDKIIEKKLDFDRHRFFICADANEIHQVLMNLATNAVQAIREKGIEKGDYIRMSAEPDPVTGSIFNHHGSAEFYHFIFEDTGTGMADNVREKIFNPLFTTKTDDTNRGQGLGLAMVHDIETKRHGGHIEVSSVPGRGSAFHLFLPKAEDDSILTESGYNIQGGSEIILVVDDETAVRESIKTALEDFGYEVILACDGEEGLDIFRTHHKLIDAVILDIIMPKMSGRQLLQEMLKIDPEVKVIISSGHREEHLEDMIIKAAKNYLTKPFEIDELEHTLRQVLDL